MRLTERQKQGLRRLNRAAQPLSPDLARQLIKKGLARKLYDCHRMEWNRVVSVLWKCELTELGRQTAKNLEDV